MKEILQQRVQESIGLMQRFFEIEIDRLVSIGDAMADALEAGRKILVCGNGGSAADAQHFAAELCGRFMTERRALAAIALTTDTSALTAISNDYGFDAIFARQAWALGRPGDILVGISTSGNSQNIIQAAKAAKAIGVKTIGLLGRDGGLLKDIMDDCLVVPGDATARIQETHIMTIHLWCEMMDERFK
jgi:D-sedoheptulose 7-phosphate isomerase